ncbi:NAD-dependent epimerase/dehydratase family protein [Paenalkalicoccus suaedae]|uniref:NAD-dependent epimerase/dehydratase family protein n=1 Tax=Paenalkalicoccus suaedae TaxID=2592382 RepID=A0A859FBR6_9BACI|nr:NAD-dependent epimerase/dehydratase family protein [Paenalkalicoccus suaedae]QKS70709.1 NAD-dependent epimerase/dehydratase family protein [Paenalkalicoccus suaedae]
MGRNVLVLGGTRFFGKRLVQALVENGDKVTVATRGETPVSSGVSHVKVDRFNSESMQKAFTDTKWDLVYDQICFAPNDAKDAIEVFKGNVSRYILTSTLSTYAFNDKPNKVEKDFDPFAYPITYGRKEDFDYGEGKRLAEAVFFQEAPFDVVAIRPPVVLGLDDYTERLHYHIRKVANNEPIGFSEPDSNVSFVDSAELAAFLLWCGDQSFTGPVNASSRDQLSLTDLLTLIENTVDKKARVEEPGDDVESSPLNFPASYYQDVALAASYGFEFSQLESWLPKLISDIAREENLVKD